MTTMIQDKNGVIAATPSTMPSDRHFRNAWVFDSAQSAITEDITTAKVIFKDKIREVRLPLLEAEDVAFMKALASQTKKINLRNAPQAAAIAGADTIDKLKAAWDESLLGTSPYK